MGWFGSRIKAEYIDEITGKTYKFGDRFSDKVLNNILSSDNIDKLIITYESKFDIEYSKNDLPKYLYHLTY